MNKGNNFSKYSKTHCWKKKKSFKCESPKTTKLKEELKFFEYFLFSENLHHRALLKLALLRSSKIAHFKIKIKKLKYFKQTAS